MNQFLKNTYSGKKVLITGHTGFKGSWLSFWLKLLGADVTGYSSEIPTDPSHFDLLNADINTVYGNILDKHAFETCMLTTQPEIVFHMAAQSLVRESYRDPFTTYNTNVIGTLNVFEAARKCKSVKAIVNITTDKVYENLESLISYSEEDKLGGYDIYSSSKACAELLSSSYRNSYFNVNDYNKTHQVLLATVRAGNVIGGGDWAQERLIPDVITKSVKNEQVIIRNPDAVRPWQHVLEPLAGYLRLGNQLMNGEISFAEAWNFGPSEQQSITVQSLLAIMKKKWDKINWQHKPADDFHEANLLRLSSRKAMQELNWKPMLDIDQTVDMTINWYRQFYENNKISTQEDIEKYMKLEELI